VRAAMTEDAVFEHLRKVPLFADVASDDLRALAAAARALKVAKSARIFEEGSAPDACFVLTAGRAKVVLSGQRGTEVIVGSVEPYELVGELALLDGSRRSGGLVAISECRLLRLPRPLFLALRNNRAFEDKLMMHITSMLRRATEQVRVLSSYVAVERVSWSLARLATRMGTRQRGQVVIAPRPSQQELAEMSGCTRETVARVLRQLKHAGRLDWTAAAYVLDEKAFKRYLDSESDAIVAVDVARLV